MLARMFRTSLPVLPLVERPSSVVTKWTPRASRSSTTLTSCASERPSRWSLKTASVSSTGRSCGAPDAFSTKMLASFDADPAGGRDLAVRPLIAGRDAGVEVAIRHQSMALCSNTFDCGTDGGEARGDWGRPINHERMPVIVTREEQFETWLNGSTDEAMALSRQYPPSKMRIVRHGFEKSDQLLAA